jgi:hypothetical protein
MQAFPNGIGLGSIVSALELPVSVTMAYFLEVKKLTLHNGSVLF